METDKIEKLSPEKVFKEGVRAMLTRRNIKQFVPMYVWMCDQKQLSINASLKKVKKVREEMLWLKEMVEEDETLEVAKRPEVHKEVDVTMTVRGPEEGRSE